MNIDEFNHQHGIKQTELAKELAEKKSLGSNQRLLQTIVESSDDAIIGKDLEGIITAWNRGAEKMYDYTATEMVGKTLDPIIPKDRQGEIAWRDAIIKKGQSIKNFETVRITKDGKSIDVSLTISPLKDIEGNLVGASTISRDITESKRMAELFRIAVEAAPNGMLLVDQKGKIILLNSQIEKLFGYEREVLMGQSMEILVPERYRARHSDYRKGFSRESQARPMGAGRDLFACRKDGTEFPVEIGLNPVKTPAGQMVLTSIINITERKKIEKLKVEMLKTQELSQIKDEFLSMASHEIRAPLACIQGGVDNIADGLNGHLNREQDADLQIIRRNVKRLTRLVNDVLDLQKLKAGQMAFKMALTDINALVRNTLEESLPTAEEKNLVLDAQLTEGELAVSCDHDKIVQVLVNLISNAIKFADKGRVTVITSKDNDRIRVAIRDEGIGIQKEDQEKLFKSFSQIPSRVGAKVDGSGLGLAISKKIIDAHHGEIGVESTYGQGATFYFELPFSQIPV